MNKEKILQYDEIDTRISSLQNELKPLQLEIKTLKIQRIKLKEELCTELVGNTDISEVIVVNLPEEENREPSSLKFSKTENFKPINNETIKMNILKFFREEAGANFYKLEDIEKTNLMYDFIYDRKNGRKVLKYNVKRNKQTKSKKEKAKEYIIN